MRPSSYGLRILILVLSAFLLSGCVKEETDVFEVREFHVQQDGTSKSATKTPSELVSIAFFDLFGAQIPAQLLNAYLVSYESVGDKQVILERIVLNFLNHPDLALPSQVNMRSDLALFVNETYKKFYARNPTDFERAYWVGFLAENPSVTSRQVYQAFLTSEEYRYY
jgi:hypothetical protein